MPKRIDEVDLIHTKMAPVQLFCISWYNPSLIRIANLVDELMRINGPTPNTHQYPNAS